MKLKRLIRNTIALLLTTIMTQTVFAQAIQLKDVTGGKYSASMVWGIQPSADGETYTESVGKGKKIERYSFKNGQRVSTVFDVSNTVGEKIEKVDEYRFSPDGTKILIATKKQNIFRHSYSAVYYVYSVDDRRLRKLSDYGAAQNAVWSPDGNVIAFVRNNNICLVKLLYDYSESTITKDGKEGMVINGVADWANEEEFNNPSTLTFTADSKMVCWLKYDESKVGNYTLHNAGINIKYPLPGNECSIVTAWSYDIQSHQTRQLQVPVERGGYITGIFTTSENDKILLPVLNRRQNELSIFKSDARSTVSQLLISDSDECYVCPDAYTSLNVKDQNILMMSARSGYTGIYVYSLNGQLKRSIEVPQTDVTTIYGMDESNGDVFFQAAGGIINRQVMVSHANGKVETLSDMDGTSSIILAGKCQYFMKCWSDINTPFQFAVCSRDGKVLKILEDNKTLVAKRNGVFEAQKKFFKFTTSEGVELNGFMVLPSDFNQANKYPVVMYQYGGPGSQQVKNSWQVGSMGMGAIYEEYLAQEGYISVCVDGRGTGQRGSEFERLTYRNLGFLEAKDQVETALWLGKQQYVDASRIAIWGWSYGGFNTLMSMSEGRPVFKCGVAVASPTSFLKYDAIYTERYMRTPAENEGGYADNPIKRAAKLNGNLLLIHGLSDDNVHPENTLEYTDELIKQDKDYSELIYNGRNHNIRGGNTRNHLFRQITNFIKTNN